MRRALAFAWLLALCALPAASLAADTWQSGTYIYNWAGEITYIGTDAFTYDSAGRLLSGTAGPGRRQDYTFDEFGNLETILTTDSSGTPPHLLGVDPQTNRLDQSGPDYNVFGEYDDRGNMISSLGGYETFTWDALGVMTTSTVGGVETFHVYGADDERVGSIAVTGPAAGTATWTMRDLSGRVLRSIHETAAGTFVWEKDYIYRGAELLSAAVPTRQKVLQYHVDHLGTPRLITGNGGVEVGRATYYPFGQNVPEQSSEDLGDLKFTGHERDSATLDYMHARYFNSVTGRFLSVDPGRDWNRRTPQSWNSYSYVRNDPINSIDPDGMQIVITARRPAFMQMDGFLGGFSNSHQLDRMWKDLTLLKNPVTGLTVREHWRASGEGVLAFADGLVPFVDPLEDYYGHGFVDGLEYSEQAGQVTQAVALSAGAGQVIKGLSLFKSNALFAKRIGILNRNDYLRIGWSWKGSRVAGEPIFRVVIGGRHTLKWLPAWLRHIDFW